MDQEGVYNSNFKRVYRFFYYKDVQPPAEIEDLVHNVLLRFFQKYNCQKLDSEESSKIIFGIAKNVYKEWVRELLNNRTTELNDEIDHPCDDDTYPDEDFERKIAQFRQNVSDAINKLSPSLKEVITMRFLDGMTRKEVAEKLKVSEKHVHVYQRRGIIALQNIINIKDIP